MLDPDSTIPVFYVEGDDEELIAAMDDTTIDMTIMDLISDIDFECPDTEPKAVAALSLMPG